MVQKSGCSNKQEAVCIKLITLTTQNF